MVWHLADQCNVWYQVDTLFKLRISSAFYDFFQYLVGIIAIPSAQKPF